MQLDLPMMGDTRLLVQTNSGGGKSRLLRLMVKRAGIQTITLANEGEPARPTDALCRSAIALLLTRLIHHAGW